MGISDNQNLRLLPLLLLLWPHCGFITIIGGGAIGYLTAKLGGKSIMRVTLKIVMVNIHFRKLRICSYHSLKSSNKRFESHQKSSSVSIKDCIFKKKYMPGIKTDRHITFLTSSVVIG